MSRLTTSDSMGAAISKQCQRVVDAAARKEAGEDSQDPQELYVQTSRLLDVLRSGVRRAAGESCKEARESFRQWVAKAVAKGAKLGHAWVRRRNGEAPATAPLVIDGTALCSVDDVVDTRARQWKAKWSTSKASAPDARLRLRELIHQVRAQDRSFADADALGQALRRLAATSTFYAVYGALKAPELEL